MQEYDEVWVVIIPSGKSHLPNKHVPVGQEELTQLNKLEMQSTSRVPLGAFNPARIKNGYPKIAISNGKCDDDPLELEILEGSHEIHMTD